MKFIDFFAGVGGFRAGMERGGISAQGSANLINLQQPVTQQCT